MLALRAPLNERVERHAVKRAEGAEQRQVRQDVPAAGAPQEFGDACYRARGCSWLREVEVDRKQAQADRPEGYETELDSVSGHAFAQ